MLNFNFAKEKQMKSVLWIDSKIWTKSFIATQREMLLESGKTSFWLKKWKCQNERVRCNSAQDQKCFKFSSAAIQTRTA